MLQKKIACVEELAATVAGVLKIPMPITKLTMIIVKSKRLSFGFAFIYYLFLPTITTYITYSHPRMPCMIAHKIDLFLLHDNTTAIMVPSPIPGPTYTGCM
jgi:hypothetical protein